MKDMARKSRLPELYSICKYNQFFEFEEWKTIRRKYQTHRATSRQRNIPFTLTFHEWLKVWLDSGKLNERGRSPNSYVMSRIGDKGGYTPGNVFIQKSRDNANENGPKKSYKIEYEGEQISVYELSKRTKIPVSTLITRIKGGKDPLIDYRDPKYRKKWERNSPIELTPSEREIKRLSEEYGLTPNTVARRLKDGVPLDLPLYWHVMAKYQYLKDKE